MKLVYRNLLALAALALVATINQSAFATFISEEDALKAPKANPAFANITEAEFRQLLADVQTIYTPVVANQRGRLTIQADWANNTPNAFATQQGTAWKVQVTGGLARRPELTADGLTLIVCHELGHHLGGFAMGRGSSPIGGVWASVEGQADYFATHVCARKLWEPQAERNAAFRESATAIARAKCDQVWGNTEEQNLCYRVLTAVESMTQTMAALMQKPAPNFDTPDPATVTETFTAHPAVQCRMDTSLQGALCLALFDEALIPGKNAPGGPFGIEAEREAARKSCTALSNFTIGLRPACWFKARL